MWFFFFHHLSSQFAVVVVSFDLTGKASEGRNVAWFLSWNYSLSEPFACDVCLLLSTTDLLYSPFVELCMET